MEDNAMANKDYLRLSEIRAVFSIDRTTLYDWMKKDSDNFPTILRPSKRIALINKREFENYLRLRSQA
jgi:predicted DNA-binding transcriptional regulator AlpA